MEHKKTLFAVLLTINLVFELASSQVRCKDTVLMEHGQRGIITCEYDLSFIAVFWYRGDSQNPFLRLEEGRPTKTDGFDITAKGYMIVEDVKIQDEDSYRISVLDGSGISHSGYTRINVTVSLYTKPEIETCENSKSEICRSLDLYGDNDLSNVIVCKTKDTRPGVTFDWSTVSSSDTWEVASESVMNSTTGLYFSYSILKYDASSFSLQYITCNANGLAVNNTRNASLFLKGSKEEKASKHHITIDQGSVATLKCANEIFILQTWNYIDAEGKVAELTNRYPGMESGRCLSDNRCRSDDNGLLKINEFSFKDEGAYECIYSNEFTSGRNIIYIDIIITPEPALIMIEGCKSQDGCIKDVGFTGNLKAFVYGSRPPVEIFCSVNEGSESDAYIFDHHNSFKEHLEIGTFDTIYTVKYDIKKCSPQVHVECKLHEGHQTNVSQSNVYLATDQSGCSVHASPSLIVIIVILVFSLVLLGLLLFWKRYNILKNIRRCSQPESDDATNEELQPALKVANEIKQFREEEVETDENILQEKKHTKDQEILPPVLPEVDAALKLFCKELKETKEVPDNRFEDLMKLFENENQGELPGVLLVNKLVEKGCENEAFPIVLKHLAKLPGTKWIRGIDVCKLLEDLTENKKLNPGTSSTIIFTLFKDDKIALITLIEVTGKLLSNGEFDETTVMTNLKDLLSRDKINQEEFANSVLQYVSSYKMNKQTVLEEVKQFDKSESKVPQLLFLQSIQRRCKLVNCEDILLQLFEDIVKQYLSPKWSKIVQQSVVTNKQVISDVYLQVLICSSADGKIPLTKSSNMLKSGVEKAEVSLHEFKEAYGQILLSEKLSDDLKREITPTLLLLLTKVESVRGFEKVLRTMFDKKQVSVDDLKNRFEKIIRSEEESVRDIEFFLETMIRSEVLDKLFWIKFIANLWKKDVMKNELKTTLMLKVANTYLIQREELKQPLDKLLGKNERRKFLQSIQFNDNKVKKELEKSKGISTRS